MRGGTVGLRGRHARCPRVAPLGARRPRRRPPAGRRARARRRPADDLQPGQARRARSRDPRRLHQPDGHARRALRDDHRRADDVLGRLRHRRAARSIRCSPTKPRGSWRTRSAPPSTRSRPTGIRRSPCSTATRSAAGSSWRSPATCGSPRERSRSGCRRPSSGWSTRTPASASSSTRSAQRAPASCSSSAGGSTRAPARAWGLVNVVAEEGRLAERGARAGGRDRRQRAARAGGQQAGHPRRARRPGGA